MNKNFNGKNKKKSYWIKVYRSPTLNNKQNL